METNVYAIDKEYNDDPTDPLVSDMAPEIIIKLEIMDHGNSPYMDCDGIVLCSAMGSCPP